MADRVSLPPRPASSAVLSAGLYVPSGPEVDALWRALVLLLQHHSSVGIDDPVARRLFYTVDALHEHARTVHDRGLVHGGAPSSGTDTDHGPTMTRTEAAKRLGVDPSTVSRMADDGRLVNVSTGWKLAITVASVEAASDKEPT